MKKIFFAIFLCLTALNVSAKRFDNCTPFQGNNGKSYCYGGVTGNGAWSFFQCVSWCDAQGGRLASLNDLCDLSSAPSDRYSSATGCRNLEGVNFGSGIYHTSSVYNNTDVYVITDALNVVHNSKEYGRMCACVF